MLHVSQRGKFLKQFKGSATLAAPAGILKFLHALICNLSIYVLNQLGWY